MNSNGKHIRQLTAGFGGNNIQPGWSPDGQKITFVHNPDLVNPVADIFTMNADGSAPFDVNPTPTAGDIEPDWGPG